MNKEFIEDLRIKLERTNKAWSLLLSCQNKEELKIAILMMSQYLIDALNTSDGLYFILSHEVNDWEDLRK